MSHEAHEGTTKITKKGRKAPLRLTSRECRLIRRFQKPRSGSGVHAEGSIDDLSRGRTSLRVLRGAFVRFV